MQMAGHLQATRQAKIESIIPIMHAKAGLPPNGPPLDFLEEVRPGKCGWLAPTDTLEGAQLMDGDIIIFFQSRACAWSSGEAS